MPSSGRLWVEMLKMMMMVLVSRVDKVKILVPTTYIQQQSNYDKKIYILVFKKVGKNQINNFYGIF